MLRLNSCWMFEKLERDDGLTRVDAMREEKIQHEWRDYQGTR